MFSDIQNKNTHRKKKHNLQKPTSTSYFTEEAEKEKYIEVYLH